jgi:DNA-binding beta-propeller fold protein YncE
VIGTGANSPEDKRNSKTNIEFQAGVYIDPRTGEVYGVNNDSHDTMVVFSRAARGNVAPDRELEIPHGSFGIAVDEENQELFLAIQHDSAVVVYRKTATGDNAPIRLLQGERTRLANPHAIALDPRRGLIFVTNHGAVSSRRPVADRGNGPANWPLGREDAIPGSGRMLPAAITVHARTASGDAAPVRVIEGPRTRLNWPTGIAVDPERGELYVANDAGESILVFDAAAQGNVAPRRVLAGPRTGLKNPTGVALDPQNGELWVANFGNHTATAYPLAAQGDVAPLRTIRSAPAGTVSHMIGNPGGVAFDTRREEILVPN